MRFPALLASDRVALAGARSPQEVGPVPELIRRVEAGLPPGARFALLRAAAVCSPLHLLAAVQGAWQALEEGSAVARDLGGETARYLAAERQVGAALSQAGLDPESQELALALVLPGETGTDEEVSLPEGEAAVLALAVSHTSSAGAATEVLLEALGWTREDELLSGETFDFAAFGLEEEVLASIPEAKWPELVLARCALLPLLK